MRAAATLLAILALSSLFSPAALAEKRVALVIGNSAYQNVSRLDNPVRDADAMRTILKDAGFDAVELKRDLRASELRRALRDFSDQVRDADVAIVYFAGHGIEVDGMNYLVPTDAVLERDIDTYDEAIALDRILTVIEPARRLRLIILDACRDNPFSKTMKRTLASRAIGRGLAKVEPANPNTLIAFAAKAGSTAADGDGSNSPFTAALVRHLPKPGLDLRKAFGFARDDVLKATNNRQEPFIYGSLGGDDYALVPGKSVEPAIAAEDVRRNYELAQQVGTSSAWAAFLRAHPAGFYADLAREQLERLEAAAKKPADEIGARKNNDDQKTTSDVAALTTTDPVKPPAVPLADVNRRLQSELARVGCYNGAVDGNWSPLAQKSILQFNKAAGTRLDVKSPGAEALDTLRSKTTRVCPLVCDHGFKPDGETCTRLICAAGFEVGDDNTCRKIAPERPAAKREAPKPAKPERSVQESAPAPQAAGRVFCDSGGCRPVPKGCRIEGRRTAADGRLVCN